MSVRLVLCTDGKTACPEPEDTGCTDRRKLCADAQPFLEPVKVVPYEFGAADVFDRESGEKLGYVLQDFYSHWTAYVRSADGGYSAPVARLRYRRDAARWLWGHR
jgi:hypothetical protein